MSLIEIFGQMDALGIGMLLGSLLFLGGLVWVLWEDEQFDGDVGEAGDDVRMPINATSAGSAASAGDASAVGPAGRSEVDTEDSPRRPPHSRRAA